MRQWEYNGKNDSLCAFKEFIIKLNIKMNSVTTTIREEVQDST